jgi:hypothetical protein
MLTHDISYNNWIVFSIIMNEEKYINNEFEWFFGKYVIFIICAKKILNCNISYSKAGVNNHFDWKGTKNADKKNEIEK